MDDYLMELLQRQNAAKETGDPAAVKRQMEQEIPAAVASRVEPEISSVVENIAGIWTAPAMPPEGAGSSSDPVPAAYLRQVAEQLEPVLLPTGRREVASETAEEKTAWRPAYRMALTGSAGELRQRTMTPEELSMFFERDARRYS